MRRPIIVDTREKKPYQFPGVPTEERTLDVGDYTLDGFEHQFAVERKTLDDLANSVGTDRLRFENEIRRANGYAERNEDDNPIPGTKPDYKLDHFVVVIEADRRDVEKYCDSKKCPSYYSRIYPNSVIGTIDGWPNKYETLRFEWAGSRERGAQETLRLLDKWYLNQL